MDAFAASTPEPHRLLFVVSRDDREELRALESEGAEFLIASVGSYPAKVNLAYRATDEPVLFLAADDLAPREGWLSAALACLDAGALVVGTNDLGNPRVLAGEHSTHTLVSRAYCDSPGAAFGQPGAVLHEGYHHWYVDDELVGLARHRGVYAHAHDSVVEHLHPYHGKAPHDATYRVGERRKRQDLAEFARRAGGWGAAP